MPDTSPLRRPRSFGVRRVTRAVAGSLLVCGGLLLLLQACLDG
ncbi:MAG TPA: hypothetical protein VIP52_04000 [Candidatus Dormibacteraeota bacterium]|jgi:hypothetical protein